VVPVSVLDHPSRHQAWRLPAPLCVRLYRALRARADARPRVQGRDRDGRIQLRVVARIRFRFPLYPFCMRFLLRLGGVLLVLVPLWPGAAYGYLRVSLPKVEGEIQLAGLGAQVEVQRDRYGIPHIFAKSLEGAVFGLGFVHAQDRLW